jgi:hypothetical protein
LSPLLRGERCICRGEGRKGGQTKWINSDGSTALSRCALTG